MMALATAAIQFVVLGLCLRAEQRISALKTYYPMLRILLGIIGALYGVGAIATVSGHLDQSPVVRLGGALVALAGLVGQSVH